MSKPRLGRGIRALLGEDIAGSALTEVPVGQISPSPFQPRVKPDEDLEELVASIKAHGILQPIMVRRKEDGYEIVAGERRFIAAKLAGLEKVPVVVGDWSDREAAILTIVENIQRKDLSPLEEALHYRRLIKEFGLTQNEIAEITGKSRPHIANVMRLLRLPDEVCDALSRGEISLGHAKALLSLNDQDRILEIYKKIKEEGLTVREVERLVKEQKPEEVFEVVPKVKARIVKLKSGKVKLTIVGDYDKIQDILKKLKS